MSRRVSHGLQRRTVQVRLIFVARILAPSVVFKRHYIARVSTATRLFSTVYASPVSFVTLFPFFWSLGSKFGQIPTITFLYYLFLRNGKRMCARIFAWIIRGCVFLCMCAVQCGTVSIGWGEGESARRECEGDGMDRATDKIPNAARPRLIPQAYTHPLVFSFPSPTTHPPDRHPLLLSPYSLPVPSPSPLGYPAGPFSFRHLPLWLYAPSERKPTHPPSSRCMVPLLLSFPYSHPSLFSLPPCFYLHLLPSSHRSPFSAPYDPP